MLQAFGGDQCPVPRQGRRAGRTPSRQRLNRTKQEYKKCPRVIACARRKCSTNPKSATGKPWQRGLRPDPRRRAAGRMCLLLRMAEEVRRDSTVAGPAAEFCRRVRAQFPRIDLAWPPPRAVDACEVL